MATAIINGFPLGILHFPIALGLALSGWAIGFINRKWSMIPAIATGVAINTVLVVLAIPVLGLAATLSFTPFLFLVGKYQRHTVFFRLHCGEKKAEDVTEHFPALT